MDSNHDEESQNLLPFGHKTEPVKGCGKSRSRPDCAETKPQDTDADLARVVNVWPDLAEDVRRAILALLAGAADGV